MKGARHIHNLERASHPPAIITLHLGHIHHSPLVTKPARQQGKNKKGVKMSTHHRRLFALAVIAALALLGASTAAVSAADGDAAAGTPTNNVGSSGISSLRVEPIPANTAVVVRVNAGKDECFYEYVRVAGTRVFFHFEVTGGGQLDIDAAVHGPDGGLVWSSEKEHEARILFKAPLGGAYRFCLSNKMSTITSKTVALSIQAGDPGSGRANGHSGTGVGTGTLSSDPVERMAMQVAEGLTELRNEQQYLKTRERIHRDTVESTNTRIMIYSVAEVLLILLVGVAQLWYLKSCFDKRRSV